jgi:hypothetical protein
LWIGKGLKQLPKSYRDEDHYIDAIPSNRVSRLPPLLVHYQFFSHWFWWFLLPNWKVIFLMYQRLLWLEGQLLCHRLESPKFHFSVGVVIAAYGNGSYSERRRGLWSQQVFQLTSHHVSIVVIAKPIFVMFVQRMAGLLLLYVAWF